VGLKRTKGRCGKTFEGFRASKADNITHRVWLVTDYCLHRLLFAQINVWETIVWGKQ
jgi:hypothetical protein